MENKNNSDCKISAFMLESHSSNLNGHICTAPSGPQWKGCSVPHLYQPEPQYHSMALPFFLAFGGKLHDLQGHECLSRKL